MDQKVKTWLALTTDDLDFAFDVLKNKKRPHFVAHLCHQSIEKLLKAIVQARTNTTPPYTHNFKILCKEAQLSLPVAKVEWLMDLAPHYIGTRYPEDLMKLQEKYTQKYCENVYEETKEIFQWFKMTYLK